GCRNCGCSWTQHQNMISSCKRNPSIKWCYCRHLILIIREERIKNKAGSQNNDVIQGLEQIMKGYEQEINLFREKIKNEIDLSNRKDVLKPENIFPLIETLFRLPINGNKIREKVEELKRSQKIFH
ncbi:unnamed protein product, partial [Rotaria sp. Silwood1]